ncbi:MAG: cytochrome c oxidase assembly protein [Candidatus Methylomirabilales bacterium]
MLWTTSWAGPVAAAAPAEVLKSYLKAIYARDYSGAYDWISQEDRKLKTKEEYLRENAAFSGAALEMAQALASLIRFEDLKTEIEQHHATITFRAVVPNVNDPAVDDLLLGFNEERLALLSPGDRRARSDQLREMARTRRLPVIEGNEQWELIRDDGSWRVFLNWAGAVAVHFEAVTKSGLPWQFVPVQPVVRATPGETLQTYYRVKNLSDREITAKSRHVLNPPEETGYLEVISCFCLLEQTLAAGEEQRLPVVFRVSYDIPESVQEIRVRYEFYPIGQFPWRQPLGATTERSGGHFEVHRPEQFQAERRE